MKNLPAQVRRILGRVVKNELTKAKAARILGISRKTLYIWLSEASKLENNEPRHHNVDKEVFRIVAKNPHLGPQSISKVLKQIGISLSARSIWLRLKKVGLSKKLDRDIFLSLIHI